MYKECLCLLFNIFLIYSGATVHVSGVDILYGTPILDIKPYIPEYDAPAVNEGDVTREDVMKSIKDSINSHKCNDSVLLNGRTSNNIHAGKDNNPGISITKLKSTKEYEHLLTAAGGVEGQNNRVPTTQEQLKAAKDETRALEEQKLALSSGVKTAEWLKEANVSTLEVIINPVAEKQLLQFSKDAQESKFRLVANLFTAVT